MTVYVDSAQHRYGRMVMCHMLADSLEELLEMATRIRVSHRWLQNAGTYREHFDICQQRRKLALDLGAKEVSRRELARILKERKDQQ